MAEHESRTQHASDENRSWRIRVPATAANLGPGFDSMGLALDRHLSLRVTPRPRGEGAELTITGQGEKTLPVDGSNLVRKALRMACGEEPCVSLTVHSDIPLARGQGSSAAGAVAGLAAGQLLSAGSINVEEIMRLGTQIEGHPDNVAPATLGSFVLSWGADGDLRFRRIDTPPEVGFVLATPDYPLSTRDARSILPERVPRADAVYNIRAAAWMAAAWAVGDWQEVGRAMVDRLHQPQRAGLIPGFDRICAAAVAAGAHGACLSGAGPTILALTTERADDVGRAMSEAWAAFGATASFDVLNADACGVTYSQGSGPAALD